MPKQFFFGAGTLYGLTTATPTPTPVKFGTLQDVSVEFSADVKELYGANQFPAHIGRGKNKITCKAKLGQIQGAMLNNLYFGLPLSTGELLSAQKEAHNIPASTPFTVTVANTTAFAQDLGVVYAATGAPLTQVPSAPTMGQYSVGAGGVYTFAAADEGAAILIDYLYNSPTTGGTIAISNQPMGLTPTFKAVLTGVTGGYTMTLVLNQCISSKLTLPTKNEDHLIVEFDFSAMADQNDNIGTLTMTE
ncbi:MAG: hypothetical protein ABSA09_00540 [Desulfobaccales bacterium]|jgi:hypothetical protein